MKTLKTLIYRTALLSAAVVALTGCESTGGGGSSQVSGSMYYGVGFYDPWYYGGYGYDDADIIVTPPDRPGYPDRPVRPEQPIARPPDVSARPPTASPRPSTRPMPSIPSAPRPMPRATGRR